MKRFALAAALALCLSACATTGVATAFDYARVTADNSFTAAVAIGEQRVRDHKMSLADFQNFRSNAYAALLLVRSASDTASLLAAQAKLADATKPLNPEVN